MTAEIFQIFLTSIIAAIFFIGAVTFFLGVYKIFGRASGSEVQAVAAQTARLVNKGITEDLAGIVGQASELLNATNSLVRTDRGAGVILVITGIILMAGSVGFAFLFMQRL